ncbi:unnamed protein product [Nezara viridula]|uniref:NADH dehydrogenase [ubiquinone] 1 beta subcomplex subunit 3 n=1 Tax=Nezara viridula TaxID=85310 RepID=A0A9P0HPA9_NEZVI|nr:unnamed protein product [Nezara viridula]
MVFGGEKYQTPDYRIYKVEEAPELVKVQEALRSQGLKDPWLRNEVWRFRECEWGTTRQGLMTFFFRGFPLGFAAFLATIALEGAVKYMRSRGGGGDGGHHGGGHGDFDDVRDINGNGDDAEVLSRGEDGSGNGHKIGDGGKEYKI